MSTKRQILKKAVQFPKSCTTGGFNVKTINLCSGVDLHIIDAPKFKTNLMSVYINIPLERETVTKAALLPAVLKRGCTKYPNIKEMSHRLDDLYGASVAAGVRMKGDGEVLYFSAEYISDKFAGENLSRRIAEFIRDFIFSPLCRNGGFLKEYVDGEKVNLKNAVLGLVNDKRAYTEFKCREAMFDGEPYGMFEAGYIEDLDEIDEKNLYEFYREVLNSGKADIFISGTVGTSAAEAVTEILGGEFKPRNAQYIQTVTADTENIRTRRITENADAVQSKLCIGMRCGINALDSDYTAMVLANCILGGSPFSKLFMNVREKLSLCYYAIARYAMMKGVLTVSSGIQTENFDAAYNEILKQIEDMKKGEISDFEISSAKKYLRNGYNSINDSLRGMEDYYLSRAILADDLSIDDLTNKIDEVTAEDISRVMNKVKGDVVYFLKGTADKENLI